MTQAAALEAMLRGDNIFLTGPPGSGKSFVLKRFIDAATRRGRKVAVTATTGIAATLLGGNTIHAWSGIGIGESFSGNRADRILANRTLRERLETADCLIIDEISMMNAPLLDKLNAYFKIARSSRQAFGGLQVILAGDFMQLPPVEFKGYQDYAFVSSAWQELNLTICYITEQHRQGRDELNSILTAIRQDGLTAMHYRLLTVRRTAVPVSRVTQLLTHNVAVDAVNAAQLQRLKGRTHNYELVFRGYESAAQRLANNILAPKSLYLKTGAMVMFVANSLGKGYCNGSQGIVVGFKHSFPVVRLFDTGVNLEVGVHTWQTEPENGRRASVSQLPLKLAWAITVHKSQGMSLERAVIDLGRSFGFNMGYVALSRLTSYDGLYLKGLNSHALRIDPMLNRFEEYLMAVSG